MACQRDNKFRASKGTLVALTHYEKEGDFWIPKKIVTGEIGKEDLKAEVWYGLNEKGKFIEVSE